jgi:hypothetical protein
MVANFCAWPFGIRLAPPSRQPSFSSTPTATVRSQSTEYEPNEHVILRGDAAALSNSSPKVIVVEAAKWRLLLRFLLSGLLQTLISSFEVTLMF